MYVKLRCIKHIDQNGVTRTFYPGDWVEIGRQTARLWIAAGEAEAMPAQRLELLPSDCAIIVRGSGTAPANLDGITVMRAAFNTSTELPHAYCLLYTTGTVLRPELLHVGFNLLSKWDAVVPILSYQQTAGQLGTPEDRAITKELIGDLRVPAYDTRLIYVRKNEAGQALFSEWISQLGDHHSPAPDERLAFLRALFIVKPRLCAAPVSWVGKDYNS